MAKLIKVKVSKNLMESNEVVAESLRKEWKNAGALVVNLLSSPGSGKTALIEASVKRLMSYGRILVLEGDIQTSKDAERLHALGVDAVQITTGGTCHLEASMVKDAWYRIKDLDRYKFIFIENVGNLVCPASFDLGESLRVVLLSVTEGDDKPAKYPLAFHTSNVLVITKIDLMPHLGDFDIEKAIKSAHKIQPNLKIFKTSAKDNTGIDKWVNYLIECREKMLSK